MKRQKEEQCSKITNFSNSAARRIVGHMNEVNVQMIICWLVMKVGSKLKKSEYNSIMNDDENEYDPCNKNTIIHYEKG